MRLPADVVARLRKHYQGRSVCVTGGAGFIGSHLVDALLSLGAVVWVIDDLSNSTLANLEMHIELEPERITFVYGSVLDDASLREAMKSAEVVFHLAALGSVPRSIDEPGRTWAVNATGTVRVLEAARARGTRVILAGSSSVYGDSVLMPRVESQPPAPVSPYALSKLAAEQAVTVWHRTYGLPGVTLRYFNVFGPRQSADSAYAAVVASFASRLLAGHPPMIFGDGSQTRDFTFVGNAVLATLLAGAVDAGRVAGEVINVGTGHRISVLELAKEMASLAGTRDVEPIFADPREGDVAHSVADIAKAKTLLGYSVVTDLRGGLEETMEWYRKAMADA